MDVNICAVIWTGRPIVSTRSRTDVAFTKRRMVHEHVFLGRNEVAKTT
jgi:hypothetical protein